MGGRDGCGPVLSESLVKGRSGFGSTTCVGPNLGSDATRWLQQQQHRDGGLGVRERRCTTIEKMTDTTRGGRMAAHSDDIDLDSSRTRGSLTIELLVWWLGMSTSGSLILGSILERDEGWGYSKTTPF